MTLRARIAAVASLAVALAVVAVAIGLYLAVRSDLRGQIDQSLTQRSQVFTSAVVAVPGARNLRFRLQRPPQGTPIAPGFPQAVQPARFGGASGYIQFLSGKGEVVVPGGQGSSPSVPPDATDRRIAASGSGRSLSDRTVKGTHLRVLTVGTTVSGADAAVAPGAAAPTGASAGAVSDDVRGAVMIARPLGEVDRELNRILLILLVVGLAGIAIAALLGALVARTALAPIVRFTRRTESLTGEMDLSERLEVSGRDELARLATSFNTTLDALQAAVSAQRELIADASHELRTPIASLRANIQVLEDAHRLPQAEQQRLRADIVDELDELTALVADVVELARGPRAPADLADVRVDEIVAGAVARARRRGDLSFDLELQPTIVRGEGDRIARAVSNLLDNARKWSPPDGVVEVRLRDGELTVRDHGPGFAPQDLGRVFERFYRA
ncbi:MAG TPA: HAMP domain-containing sensor histidine kinase, partial [Solirubrobacteraceae bacterium]|nr:HAMP domain-containing sensor histidine kinase [Solirubrobacteraceae bacterium]